MRPAQKAPENRDSAAASIENPIHFNEAGAKSAGKPIVLGSLRNPVPSLQ